MKNVLISTLLSVVFFSCADPKDKVTGYILAKIFTQEHMSNQKPIIILYLAVFFP